MVSQQEGFKNSYTLTFWVKYFLYIQIAVAIASVLSGYMESKLLTVYQGGMRYLLTPGKALAIYQAQRVIGFIHIFVFVVSGILILKWIYRANYNASQLGAREMQNSPAWSIGWYFIPIAAFWMPYLAMKEIWKASHEPNNWHNVKTSSILPWWWFLWLTQGFLVQAVLRMWISADKTQDFINTNYWNLAINSVSILLALATLSLINNIYKAQVSHAEKNSTRMEG